MANLSEKMINLIDQIDDINNIDDYKIIYNAVNDHRLKYQFATGKSVDEIPTEEDWHEFILQSIYDRTGDERVFTNPELFLEPNKIDINIEHYPGVKYLVSNGYNISEAFYYYSPGEDITYGLQVELIKNDDSGISTIRFEDNRTGDEENPLGIMVSCGVEPILPNPLKLQSPHNNTLDELYAMINIIETLEKDFPDPFHIK